MSRYSDRMNKTNDIPNDVAALQVMLREQTTCMQQLTTLVKELQGEREGFQRKIAELELTIRKLLEGKRREKFVDPNQKLLPFGDDPEWQEVVAEAQAEAEKITESITYTREKRKQETPRTEKFPEHLRREVIEMQPTEEERVCWKHGERKIIRHDEVETLKFKRPEVYVEVRRYPVMACSQDASCGIRSPERAMGLCEGNRFDATIGAATITNKFAYHLPYYRQQDMFGANGWTPSRSTLDNITSAVDFALEPLVNLMRKRLLTGVGIGLDETTVTLLLPSTIPSAEKADLKTLRLLEKIEEAVAKDKPSLDAKMWVYTGLEDQPYNVFDFRVSRHRDGPQEFLAGYGGYVMADCYSGNLSVILGPESRMTRMACWAHARRHMHEARENFEVESVLPLALMSQLYDVERRATPRTSAERHALRQSESRRIVSRLREWLDGPIARDALPKSGFGKAVTYLRNHWDALTVFLTDGRLVIDNNFTERLMKQIATGRKNWLFCATVRSGERNARIMSLVSSAHRHDLDVATYLEDILRRVLAGSTDYESMLPDRWKATHASAIRTYRVEERRDQAERAQYRAALRRQLKAATTPSSTKK